MCPGCYKSVEHDMTDSRGRMWHTDCAQVALTNVSPNAIAACPHCQGFVAGGDACLYDAGHRRKWHLACVPKALAAIT